MIICILLYESITGLQGLFLELFLNVPHLWYELNVS